MGKPTRPSALNEMGEFVDSRGDDMDARRQVVYASLRKLDPSKMIPASERNGRRRG